ncbi:MAG: hypothetical protein H0V92_09550 [Pseudonocardiales bacterium]|nr:hypothetical protein [Pseudonocardiales bacterium]
MRTSSALSVGASFVLLYFGARSLPALVAGVVVLNGGVQVMSVLNLSVIYALAGEARSRVNANYMVMYFVGGAVGSAAGAGDAYSSGNPPLWNSSVPFTSLRSFRSLTVSCA